MIHKIVAVIFILLYGAVCFVIGGEVAFKLINEENDSEITVPLKNSLTFSTSTENMQVRWVSDPKEVRKVLDEYWAQKGVLAVGLSMTIGKSCVIYAFEPKYENDRNMQILGHEALHCFRGKFHE